MKIGLLSITLGVVLLIGANAFAQDQPTQIEVAVDYSLVNFHAARGSGANNLNGGGGSFVYYFPLRWLGVKADLQGYASSGTTFTIPAGNTVLPQGGTIVTQ